MVTATGNKPPTKIHNFDLINLEFLEKNRFLLGNVYLKSKTSEKRFFLLKVGEYLKDEQLEEYKRRNLTQFEYEPIVTKQIYLPWFNALNEIKFALDDSTKIEEISRQLKVFYTQNFLKKEIDSIEVIGIIEAHLRIFGHGRGKEVVKKFLESNVILFKRQALLASACMIPLFLMGHEDFKFLEDVFVAILLCDYSIWSSCTIQNDRILKVIHDSPLDDMALKNALKLGFNVDYHSQAIDSYQQALNFFNYKFEYDCVAEIIARRREWCLPSDISFNIHLVNDWMAIVFFFDLLLPHHTEDSFQVKAQLKNLTVAQQDLLNYFHKILHFLNMELGLDVFAHLKQKKVANL